MRQELHLFLGNKEIEFNQPPELLYNYTENDLKNPSVVKNSYSKTLSIEGTPNNNQIFGHFWDLERIQSYGSGTYSGSYFNPLQKADFQLFLNGEIYESGYFKLDKVKKTGNNIVYEITLYGGLGSFFYNLTYSHTTNESGANEVTGPDKLTLNDLDYSTDDYPNPDLDFTINKETLNTAWNTIIGGDPDVDDKFRIVNFAPAYNGKPKDFDAGKVIINNQFQKNSSNETYLPNTATDNGKTYRTYNPSTKTASVTNGYTLGETTEELTEWEAGNDLRSYLQRPVLRMKSVIDACCKPENNLGYEVKLDETFFNTNNPYYQDSWLTMPMLRDLGIEKMTETITSATIEKSKNSLWNINVEGTAPFVNYSNVNIGVLLSFTPSDTVPSDFDKLYLNYYRYFYNNKKYWYDYKHSYYSGALLVQLVAFDEVGEVVGVSDVNYLYSKRPAQSDFYNPSFDTFKNKWTTGWNGEIPSVTYRQGYFKKDTDGKFYWSNYSQIEALQFTLKSDKTFSSLALRFMPLTNNLNKEKKHEPMHVEITTIGPSVKELYSLYNPDYVQQYGEDIVQGIYRGSFACELDENNISLEAKAVDGLFSGTKIRRKDYLTTDKTPCDYLLSYCKQFGLYFYKDANEVSSDPVNCPNGVIHIMSRNSFYDINDVVNLEKYIDRSKEMTITPQIPATKWYDFGLEVEESEAEKEYENAANMPFGNHRLNTGYNFDADKTEVFADNAFKGGVMVLEKDKYYQYPDPNQYDGTSLNNMYKVPTYAYNGINITLYNKNTTDGLTTFQKDSEVKVLPTTRSYRSDSYKGYDLYPKLQLHKKDNESIDGDGILLFYRHPMPYYDDDQGVYGKIDYWLTDDIQAMVDLNDGKACWLMTPSTTDLNNNTIAIRRDTIPYFSRYIDYQSTGTITHTWDIGRSRGFVPFLYETEGMSIYDKCWRNYANDIYSVNTKLLTCYCLLENRPNPEWLRRFYWFDNSIWRLNKIIDWNVSSYDTTKMEFIKVQDLNNYTLDTIDKLGSFYLVFNQSSIGYSGGEVTGYMYGQDMGSIWLDSNIIIEYEDGEEDYLDVYDYITPTEGEGKVEFVFNVPENERAVARTLTIKLPKEVVGRIRTVSASIKQSANTAVEPLKFKTTTKSVSRLGGDDIELEYTAINGVSNLDISTNVSWITSLQFESEGWIVFDVANNTTYLQRSGVITLTGTYEGDTYTTECTITQGANIRPPRPDPDGLIVDGDAFIDIDTDNDFEENVPEEP